MESFDSFRFIDETIKRLKIGVCGDKPCHAVMLCGVEGVGKRTLAGICSRAVNCMSDGVKPCDTCDNCLQYLSDSHPDHIIVKYEGKAISVAAIRQLTERLGYKPFEGGRYTVVIERADEMTVQAQNALLKTLEEPPSDAVFFLIAQNGGALLPTIRSRCRTIRIPALTEDECGRVLAEKGFERERARTLAIVSQGSVGKAMALDSDEGYWRLRDRAIAAVAGVGEAKDISLASSIIKDDRASASTVIDIIEQIAERMLRTGENPHGISLKPERLLEAVILARQMLKSNVSWQTAFERMLFAAME
ncbi:MAG: DNA polymerase III subunit delta' [Clostridia bacterium]|nr:DNA polymerase III subunit delta' [Clostridia bacterium]